MEKIHHHYAAIMIESRKNDEFLFSVYDNSYPIEVYRGRVNLMGGNANEDDISPLSLLKRELEEEFSTKEGDIQLEETIKDLVGEGKNFNREFKTFASSSDMRIIKKAITKDIQPFRDYLVEVPFLNHKSLMICSSYLTMLPMEKFELVKENLRKGLRIINEGTAKVVSINDLISGNILTAWITGIVVGEYKGVRIPSLDGVIATCIGYPRKSFHDYLHEFNYIFPKGGFKF